MQACGHIPLISPLLYRFSVGGIARRAARGDLSAVRELAGVFCTAPDPKARARAGQGLRCLPIPTQAGALCMEALLRDDPSLLALARECQYLPVDPGERALWQFCTARPAGPGGQGPEIPLPLLAAGYAAATPPLRLRVRDAARKNCTGGILAHALAGPDITLHAGEWLDDEWDLVVSALIGERQWDDLWLLAPLAPVPLAITAIGALKEAGWAPPGDDRLLWDGIAGALPPSWTFPVPAGRTPVPAMRPAGPVARLAFSPDGSLFATGSRDGRIAVRRTGSAGPVAEFPAGTGSVRFLAFSLDNAVLVYGGEDGTVHGYGLQEGVPLWSAGNLRDVTAFSVSPDGRAVWIGTGAGTLHQHEIRSGRLLHALQAHPSRVTCLGSAPGGSSFVSGHADGTVAVVSGSDLTTRIIPGNGSPVHSLSFSPAGTELLVLYEQGSPVLVDPATGVRIRVFSGPAGRVVCSAASAGGEWFATWSSDNTLRCWHWQTPAPATVVPFRRTITCCAAVPGGSLLVLGFHDGKIRLCRMPGAGLVEEFRGHQKTVGSCTVTPDGTRLATVSWDGTTRIWRLPGREIVRTLDPHAEGIVSLAGPAGELIATATGGGIARIVDASAGTLVRTIDLYTPSVRAAAVSPDGTALAIAGADASVRIWNIRDGSLLAAADPLRTSLRCCTFLPDRSALVTGGWDGALRIFRVSDLKLLETRSGHTSTVTCCTISRDGTLFVTGSNDTTVRLWDARGEDAYAVLAGARAEVNAVALSPDGTLLAAGGADGTIRLYRLPYGTPAGELPGLPWKVTALAFTPDSYLLVAGTDHGVCAFFSVPAQGLIRTLPCHTGAVTGLVVLPDDRTFATTGVDGTCRFHPLPCAPFPARADLADLPGVEREEESARGSADHAQWKFLRALLAARFRGEILISPASGTAGCYDIQIAG